MVMLLRQIISANFSLTKGTVVALNEDSLSFRAGCYTVNDPQTVPTEGFKVVELLHDLDFKQGEVVGLDEDHAKAFIDQTIPFDFDDAVSVSNPTDTANDNEQKPPVDAPTKASAPNPTDTTKDGEQKPPVDAPTEASVPNPTDTAKDGEQKPPVGKNDSAAAKVFNGNAKQQQVKQ